MSTAAIYLQRGKAAPSVVPCYEGIQDALIFLGP